MSILKKIIYMGLGGVLALALFIGAFAAFAQSGTEEPSDPDTGAVETPSEEESVVPPFDHQEFGFRGFDYGSNDRDLLADALGITADELDAAYESAYAAAIQEAVDQGLITAEQAEMLSNRMGGFHHGFAFGIEQSLIDFDALLADELGITVEQLNSARNDVQAARLAELVEAGVLTQEEADLMAARHAVQSYIDQDAISEAIQAAYESAVNQALSDGVITAAQAEQLLENGPAGGLGGFGVLGRPEGRGFHGPGGRGFQGGPNRGFFSPSFQAPAFNGSAGA